MRTFYTDGMKNIELPQYPDSAWTFYTNPPETEEEALYGLVAMVYRAVNITADALASLPFAVTRGSEDVDTWDNWDNVVGFMPDPFDLLRRWRMSWFMTNKAYGFMESGRNEKLLRYIVPSTIKPQTNAKDGIKSFIRKVGNEQFEYPYEQGSTKNRVYPLYLLDHTVELLPSDNTEFKACMNAAGVLYYTDFFVRDFFKRGGVIPSIIGVKGVTNQAQQDKIERAFDKLIKNVYKYVAQVWNSEAITISPLGQGVDALKDTALYEQSIANVAAAAGIPLSLLLSNSASYATALEEKKTWFNNKIVPDAKKMQTALNRELFEPNGYRFEFRYEASDEGTDEEVQRASAYVQYVNAGMRPSIAVQILGIELPNDMEPEQLDKIVEEDKEKAIERQREMFPERQGQQPPQEEERRGPPRPPAPPSRTRRALSPEQVRELINWQAIARRRAKKGEIDKITFEVRTLPDDIADEIRAGLEECKSIEDVDALFDIDMPEELPDDIKMLADALNKFADAETKQAPSWTMNMPAITVNTPENNYTFNPELKAEPAVVNVTVPEQQPPVVNVTNNVPVPDVTVNNEVKPAQVKLKGPNKAKVVRNADGRIEGIETE